MLKILQPTDLDRCPACVVLLARFVAVRSFRRGRLLATRTFPLILGTAVEIASPPSIFVLQLSLKRFRGQYQLMIVWFQDCLMRRFSLKRK